MGDNWRVFPGGYPQIPGSRPQHQTKRYGRGEIRDPNKRPGQRGDAPHERPAQESLQGSSPGDPVTGNPGGVSDNTGDGQPPAQ